MADIQVFTSQPTVMISGTHHFLTAHTQQEDLRRIKMPRWITSQLFVCLSPLPYASMKKEKSGGNLTTVAWISRKSSGKTEMMW